MQKSVKPVIILAALTVALCVPAFAQEYEIHPYAGGLFIGGFNSTLNFKNPAIYGLKGGAFLTDTLMIEGNVGLMNQVNFRGYDYNTHGVLYEAAGNYNFYRARTRGVVPFVTFGIGGLTVHVSDGLNNGNTNQIVYVIPMATPQPTAGPIPNTINTLVVSNNDTFFNFSYGGGVRAQRLWGPMGLRADIRGRTLPNFFGQSISSFEATGGLLFSWGER